MRSPSQISQIVESEPSQTSQLVMLQLYESAPKIYCSSRSPSSPPALDEIRKKEMVIKMNNVFYIFYGLLIIGL